MNSETTNEGLDGSLTQGAEANLVASLTREGAPFALETIILDDIEYQQYSAAPKHLGEIIQRAASRRGRTFVVTDGESISYDTIFSSAAIFSDILTERYAVMPGQRVGLIADNATDWIVAFFGIIVSGGTAVLINKEVLTQSKDCLALTYCKLTIADRHARQFLAHDERISLMIPLEEFISLAKGMDQQDTSLRVEEKLIRNCKNFSAQDEAIIALTSGTTGEPKAVILTHRGLINGLMNMMLSGALALDRSKIKRFPQRPPCPLILASFAHISGYSQILMTAMLGGKFAFTAMADARHLLKFVSSTGVTSILGLDPSSTRSLLRHNLARDALKGLQYWNISGISLDRKLVAAITAAIPEVVLGTGYGLTETNGTISAISGRQMMLKPGSSGRIVPTVEIKVTDPCGNELENGVIGNIWLRGAMLMSGYCIEGNRSSGIDDGWFCTGDTGYVSSDSHLFISDRCVTNTVSALGISISNLESLLSDLEAVDDACVVELRQDQSEALLAFAIVFRHNESDFVLLEDVVAPLIKHKIKLFFFQCVRLPRTFSGKIDRNRVGKLADAAFIENSTRGLGTASLSE